MVDVVDHYDRCGGAVPSIVLVQMPFQRLSSPAHGLHLLQVACQQQGIHCAVEYANLGFAQLIGIDAYDLLSSGFAPELLVGDLVFSDRDVCEAKRLYEDENAWSNQAGQRRVRSVVPALWELLTGVQRQARDFVSSLALRLASSSALVIGLSSMFQLTPNIALARALRSCGAPQRLVLGGAHCEGVMGRTIHSAFGCFDYVLSGEGEEALPRLFMHLTEGTKPCDIPGLSWSEPDTGVHQSNPGRAAVRDLNTVPFPEFGSWLAATRELLGDLCAERAWLPFETSRGCWWGQRHPCTFCGLNGERTAFRSKAAATVLSELKHLAQYGVRHLHACDCILDREYFRSLLPRVAAEGFPFVTFFEVKASLNRSQVALLARANLRSLQPGIESLSTPILRLMRKGTTALQNIRLLKWAAEYGISIAWNFLYGFPNEPVEEYQAMARIVPLIRHLQPPHVGCCPVRIDRFSPLFSDSPRFGIRDLAPVPAYQAVYRISREELASLAYYFRFTLPQSGDPEHYVKPLREAVEKWHRAVGSESFLSIADTQGRIKLYDRRSVHGSRGSCHLLEGLEARIFAVCDDGASIPRLCRDLAVSEACVNRVVEPMLDRGWLLGVDEKYVSLAVDATHMLPPHDVAITAPLAHCIYQSRMAAMTPRVPPLISDTQTGTLVRP